MAMYISEIKSVWFSLVYYHLWFKLICRYYCLTCIIRLVFRLSKRCRWIFHSRMWSCFATEWYTIVCVTGCSVHHEQNVHRTPVDTIQLHIRTKTLFKNFLNFSKNIFLLFYLRWINVLFLKDVTANTWKKNKIHWFFFNKQLWQRIKLWIVLLQFVISESRKDVGIRLKRKDMVNLQVKSSAFSLEKDVLSHY